ncbi:Dynamin-like GTPase that mediates homotypic ER fusion [Savitreella phatthalungensis]
MSNVQVITGEKAYNGDDVAAWVKSLGSRDYHVVSVFGSQSTGKSTLLNALFGTNFATMNEGSRQQTTKGIWLASALENKLLVMDVEGTDGRERGDDQDFERKAALFSLAISEVLVVNMWETQVGLFHGANMALLKTVFDVDLQIFGSARTRSCLLFVLRDHLGTTPLDSLAQTLTADLDKMWAELSKPDGLKDAKLADFFDLQFAGLGHKVLTPDKFDNDVRDLRQRFEAGLIKTEYARDVPLDGFPAYASQIWQVILENKDLDLPSQQLLLSQYRCGEITTEALLVFRDAQSDFGDVENMEDLGQKSRTAMQLALRHFDEHASRYQQTIYEKQRGELQAQIAAALEVLFEKRAAVLRNMYLEEFLAAANTFGVSADFVQELVKTRAAVFQKFADKLADASYQGSREDAKFEQALDRAQDEVRARLLQRYTDDLVKSASKKLESIIAHGLDADDPTWSKVMPRVEEEIAKQKQAHGETLKQLDAVDPNVLGPRLQEVVKDRLAEETSNRLLVPRMRLLFEEKFKYKDGLPVVWQAGDDIDKAFASAKDGTFRSLENLCECDGETLIDEERHAEIVASVRRFADTAYIEAKRSAVSSIARVPPWFYVLLLLLGWNELVAVLRSPMTFLLIAFCGLVGWAVYIMNLAGPLEQIGRSALGTGWRIAQDKLRQVLEPGQPPIEMHEMHEMKKHK